MSLQTALDRLQKSVETLAHNEGNVEMSPEKFVEYATEQVEKAGTDKEPAVRVARLKALAENINVAKDFIGSPKTPGGLLSVKQFSDPAQVKQTEKTIPTINNPADASLISSNPVPNAQAGVGSTPSGGTNPPITAPGSGFDSPATATFAKSLDDLGGKIETLIAKVGKADDDKTDADADKPDDKGDADADKPDDKGDADADKPDDKGDGDDKGDADADAKGDKGDVEKDAKGGTLWPLDMNSKFGMGEVEKPDEPEWGWDHGKGTPEADAK